MMKVKVIDSFDGFQKLEPIWNDLLCRSDIDIPFMTFEWFSCWWQAFTGEEKPFILLVKENGRIVGIAPLMETKIRYRKFLQVKAITFIANKHTSRAGLILIEKKKEAVCQIITFLCCKYRFDIVKFGFIEEDTDTARLLSEVLNEQKAKYRRIASMSSPYIPVDKDWDSYLKCRSKTFRKSLRRMKDLLEEDSCYGITVYSHSDLTTGLEDLLEISRNSWKFKHKTAIACIESETEFYSMLIKVLAARKWLKLWILRADGRPIAFDLTITYKKKNYSLKTSFDERYRHLSPGFCLDSHVIRHYFERKDHEIDLVGDKSEYKMKWTNLLREHKTFLIFGQNTCGQILCFFELVIVPVAKKLRCRLRRRIDAVQ